MYAKPTTALLYVCALPSPAAGYDTYPAHRMLFPNPTYASINHQCTMHNQPRAWKSVTLRPKYTAGIWENRHVKKSRRRHSTQQCVLNSRYSSKPFNSSTPTSRLVDGPNCNFKISRFSCCYLPIIFSSPEAPQNKMTRSFSFLGAVVRVHSANFVLFFSDTSGSALEPSPWALFSSLDSELSRR